MSRIGQTGLVTSNRRTIAVEVIDDIPEIRKVELRSLDLRCLFTISYETWDAYYAQSHPS
jgi:hypothetical protein